MTKTHIDSVEANSRAFSSQDAEAMLEFYAPDAVVTDRRPVGWGEFRGHSALRSYYQGLFDNTDELHEELEVVEESGDVVVAACRLTARLAGQPDAGEVTFDYVLRISFADGLIAEMDIFEDVRSAVAAGS